MKNVPNARHSNISFTKLIILLFSFLLGLLLVGCNTENKTATEAEKTLNENQDKNTKTALASLEKKSQDLLTEIRNNIGSAECDSNKQCGALAIGHKACGGPSNYLAYSTKNTNTTSLLEQSTQQQAIEKQINQLNNSMSDCAFISPPTVICLNKQCRIK